MPGLKQTGPLPCPVPVPRVGHLIQVTPSTDTISPVPTAMATASSSAARAGLTVPIMILCCGQTPEVPLSVLSVMPSRSMAVTLPRGQGQEPGPVGHTAEVTIILLTRYQVKALPCQTKRLMPLAPFMATTGAVTATSEELPRAATGICRSMAPTESSPTTEGITGLTRE